MAIVRAAQPIDHGASSRLTVLASQWVLGRRARGEITADTAVIYRKILRRFITEIGAVPPERVSARHIERWLTVVADRAPATRRMYFSTVRSFCRWLAAEKHIKRDPTMKVAAPRPPRSVPRALTVDEVSACIDACRDTRERLAIWLMVGMGLRRAEVTGLQLGDWDRSARVLYVTGKGGHTRMLPMPAEVEMAAVAYLAEHPAVAGPLVRSKSQPHEPITAETLGQLVRGVMRSAGVKRSAYDGKACHSFRHTAASDVVDREPDLRVVQQMLGHTALTSTQIYLRRATLSQLRTAMEGRTYGHGIPSRPTPDVA